MPVTTTFSQCMRASLTGFNRLERTQFHGKLAKKYFYHIQYEFFRRNKKSFIKKNPGIALRGVKLFQPF